jgi:hypothetical protein
MADRCCYDCGKHHVWHSRRVEGDTVAILVGGPRPYIWVGDANDNFVGSIGGGRASMRALAKAILKELAPKKKRKKATRA